MPYNFKDQLETKPHLKKFCELDPKFKADWIASKVKQIQITLKRMLEQSHDGKYAIVDVQRNGYVVTIKWRFRENISLENEFHVMGLIREMSLHPSSDYDMDDQIVDQYGSGSCQLNLQEGCSYLIALYFFDLLNGQKIEGPEKNRTGSDCISFQVVVPLSDENKKVLNEVDRRPEARVKHAMGQFLDLEDTFDETLKNGIERIKQKKLSPEDESEQISRLVEHAAQLKERAGL